MLEAALGIGLALGTWGVFPLQGSGVWLIKAVHVARGKEARDWNSLWASLILEVP